MNNKILARIVAVVLAVMMLGTVSFAAELTDGNIVSDFTADTAYANQTTKTMLAYKAATADATLTSDDQIIAIAQGGDEVLSVPVADVNTDYINVVYGGIDGVTRTATIDLRTVKEFGAIDSLEVTEVEVEGTTFTNVIEVTFTFDLDPSKTINKVGVEFRGTKDGEKYGADVFDAANFDGEGKMAYTAYLFGVTAEDIEADNLIAVPYVNFAE